MKMILTMCATCLLAGCNTPWGPTPPIPLPTPSPTPTVAPTPAPDPYAHDDLDLSTVRWFGTDYSRAQIATRILSARTNGKTIYTDYEPYGGAGWPVMFGDSPKPCDAIACLFYRNAEGRVVGGKFDWWKIGGALVKGLENIHPREVVQPDGSVVTEPGYGGHTGLIPGAECWEMIVSTDGKLRSNAKRVVWK